MFIAQVWRCLFRIQGFVHRRCVALYLRCELILTRDNRPRKIVKKTGKNLYASAVGAGGKAYLEKVIREFGRRDLEYWIFVYDDTTFDEEIFNQCRFVREKGLKWYFMKKYLTPAQCEAFDYIFVWDDDLDIGAFSYKRFIQIMEANDLDVAQPALAGDNWAHRITCQRERGLGRLVDFVEIMAPVFTREAWKRWWYMMESDSNGWGFYYDDLAKSYCGYKRMAVIDAETVNHAFPPKCAFSSQTSSDRKKAADGFLKKWHFLKRASHACYGSLRQPIDV